MMLTVREAAVLLGKPARTVRAMLARGELRGVRKPQGWVIAQEALPITPARFAETAARAAQIRAEVERALPSRTGAKKTKSVADMAPFLAVREVVGSLPPEDPAVPSLVRALHALTRAAHRFHAADKRPALLEARDALCDAVTSLLLSARAVEPATAACLRRLEGEALAQIGGLLRWTERGGAVTVAP